MPTPSSPSIATTQTLTDILSHLVRFPTITSDKATNRAALDWVEDQLQGLPLHITRPTTGGFSMLIATTRPTRNPRLWLTGHMDVVPGAPSTFKPSVRDGRLYGRGAHDMKAGIAVFIALLQELGDSLANYDLGLMLTSDEEVGGAHGVKWLLQQGYRGGAAFMPDSGISWGFENGSKGVMWWDLTSHGISSHASRPWEGVNAIDQLMDFVQAVRSNLTPEPCSDPLHDHPTINLGIIKGGAAANQVPNLATARLDIRVSPDLTLEDANGWIEAARQRFPQVEAKNILADPPYKILDERATVLFRQIAHDITGHQLPSAIAHGSSDARFFAAYKIPTVNVSPLGSGFHVPHEWVDIAELAQYYEATRRFVARWCAPSK